MKKVEAGLAIELDDAVLLSRASIPLLGRIVQSHPASVGWTSESVPELKPDAQASGDSSASLARRALMTDSAVRPTEPATGLPRQIAQPLSDWEPFCKALIETRRELEATRETVLWFPQVTEPPDTHGVCDGDFTGVDVLRAIALARLVLPANVQIVAPLSTLGPKLAQVALEFGAEHLGFAASDDGQSPDRPLMADRGLLDELRGSCSPTPLKEDL